MGSIRLQEGIYKDVGCKYLMRTPSVRHVFSSTILGALGDGGWRGGNISKHPPCLVFTVLS